MVLHSHAECIDKDCYHYPSVEVLAVHNPPQNGSGIMNTHTHTVLIPRLLFIHILVSFALFWADVWPWFLWVRFTVGAAINTIAFLGANWAGGRLWRHQSHPAVHTHTRARAWIHTCSEGRQFLISHTGKLGLEVSKTVQVQFTQMLQCFPVSIQKLTVKNKSYSLACFLIYSSCLINLKLCFMNNVGYNELLL